MCDSASYSKNCVFLCVLNITQLIIVQIIVDLGFDVMGDKIYKHKYNSSIWEFGVTDNFTKIFHHDFMIHSITVKIFFAFA